MQSAAIKARSRFGTPDAICVALLILYFLYFALPARHGGFREDEMLNMWLYWKFGAFKCLLANAMFWMPSDPLGGAFGGLSLYRPAGVLYYLPLYHFFGLNPFPYRIVQISILALSIPIVYYLARLLVNSRSVAFLAVLAFCYHPYLANLVFVGAFIYDVLCGVFYLAALAYYFHFRERNICLGPLQLLTFLLLYVLALDSKEMAVTLPIITLAYEFLKTPVKSDFKALLRWIQSNAMPSLIAGAITAIYLYTKLYGSGSLTRLDPYRPRYSWHQFISANAKFLGELFFAGNAITPNTFLIFWAAILIYAALRRDRTVRLMALWVIIVPLPIAFILPIRGGACLYLLLFGWAMLFAKAAADLALLISSVPIAVGQVLGAGARKIHASSIRIVVIAVTAVCLTLFTDWQNRRLGMARALLGLGEKVNHVIAGIDSLKLQPAPHSTVLLKPDEQLFQNKWHPLFIASLVWNDRSLQIGIEKLNQFTPEQLAKVDYIISLTEFEATLIRSPSTAKTK